MHSSALEQRIQGIIEPSLAHLGYTVVHVRMMEGTKRRTLQVMAERKDGVNMGFDDCENISHTVSALLDVEDPITTAYHLEVISPGIDRPLTRLEDFTRFLGFDAKAELEVPIEGRRRFSGTIKKVEGEKIFIEMEGDMHVLQYSNIRSAKLLLTDALIASVMKQHKQRKKEHK